MMNIPATKVAIEPIYDSDLSPSGLIIIPDDAKGRVTQGFVKYKGKDVVDLDIGDYVLFGGYSGTVVFVADEGRTIIIDEKFIVAKIDPPDNIKNTEVPGLFFMGIERDTDSMGDSNDKKVYFPATYEIVLSLVAQMVKNTPFRRTFKTNLANIELRESKKDGYDFKADR